MCEKAFRKHKLNFNELVHSKEMEAAARDLNFKTVDDLIANIGYGKVTPVQLVGKLAPDIKPKKEETLFTKLLPRRKGRKTEDSDGIIVDVNLESKKDKMVNGFFTISVKNIDHLDDVVAKLKKIDMIQEISRA